MKNFAEVKSVTCRELSKMCGSLVPNISGETGKIVADVQKYLDRIYKFLNQVKDKKP